MTSRNLLRLSPKARLSPMAEPRATTEAAEITLRDLDRTDFDWLLALNNASVPHVNHLEQADLAEILALAAYARGSFRDGAPAGALIAPTLVPQGGVMDLLVSWTLVAILFPVFIFGCARLSRTFAVILVLAFFTYAALRVLVLPA